MLVGLVAVVVSSAAMVLRGPFVWRVPEVAPEGPDPSAARLERAVRFLSAELGPRDHRNPDNLNRAADWIAAEFREAGLVVEEQEYTVGEDRFRNVVARRGGADASTGAVIVGAHYDAFGELPGADDNASGVAVLLELARVLPGRSPRRSQILVAFATEEPPHFGTNDMGSARFVGWLDERAIRVDLAIALDLVGYFSDEPGSQGFPFPGLGLLYPGTGNFIAVVGDLRAGPWIARVKRGLSAEGTLPVFSFRAPSSVPGVLWSDHLAFRRAGLPGVLVTDTAFMRNPHYHEPTDTAETLDFERMAAVVRGLRTVLALEERSVTNP